MVDNVLPYLRKSWVLMKPASSGMWWQLLQAVLKLSGHPFLAGTRKESSSEPHPEDPVYFIHGKVTQYGDLLTYSLLQILKLAHTQPLVINQNYDLFFLCFWLLWLISREAGVGCGPSGNCPQISFSHCSLSPGKLINVHCFFCFPSLVTDFKVFAHEKSEPNSLNSLWYQ